ncbi:OsmC family protein [Danxiaibacter flavus]|uniref:OsmC family protein n=1 Tax=Danxiaibacter flavus TaxID=3049108 RepID=A0ABV3ZDQ9_9BACT|nr:OsmC family protein [Chitinophagaceae bacterium DXS]
MTSQIIYKGDLRTQATHLQSNTIIETDAPTDNHGKGERFSPTDIVATALGSCMLTIMGIKARDLEVNLDGTSIEITKIMAAEPRRIGGIKVTFNFPEGLQVDEKQRTVLERAAITCPVAKSLHPDLVQDVVFNW